MLTELRTAIADKLTAADIKTTEYIGETITPPCAVAVPGRPYIRGPRPGERSVPFGHVVVRLDVLLVISRDGAKSNARRIDEVIEQAYAALDDHDITEASQPGVVTLSGAKFMASVITIEEITEEP